MTNTPPPPPLFISPLSCAPPPPQTPHPVFSQLFTDTHRSPRVFYVPQKYVRHFRRSTAPQQAARSVNKPTVTEILNRLPPHPPSSPRLPDTSISTNHVADGPAPLLNVTDCYASLGDRAPGVPTVMPRSRACFLLHFLPRGRRRLTTP